MLSTYRLESVLYICKCKASSSTHTRNYSFRSLQVFTVSTWNFSPKLALKLVIPIVLGFGLLGLSGTTLIALCIDDVSVHVCPHLPFILAFPTIENGSFEIP